ncbi:MAG: ribosome recycling factor [Deltaproteobacteria bacterium]|nr:ribosome recycling factor [Deltaproteobacteria bacterium]
MALKNVFDDSKRKMDKAIELFMQELLKLRTGRASTAILDDVKVDYYGTATPLPQMASLSVPESRLITVQPWDMSQLGAIEKAIISSGLGLTPTNDGKLIRIQIPQPTEERRKELVKVAKKYCEDAKVAIRNVRRDANEAIKKLEKDKAITQDDLKKGQQHVQDVTDKEIKKIDSILADKEKEIMEV